MTSRLTAPRRSGFSLIELLTVVAIIALLIGILIPALSNVRRQARAAASLATVKAVGDSLEIFHNDFGDYPSSSRRQDPIEYDVPGDDGLGLDDFVELTGAHWLARALSGHDLQGIDVAGAAVARLNAGDLPPLESALKNAERRNMYLKGDVFVRDSDPRFVDVAQGPNTDRHLIVDTFGFPIIYYRANPRAQYPFSFSGSDNTATNLPPENDDTLGVYNQQDNDLITGSMHGGGAPLFTGWRFGVGPNGPLHGLGDWGGDYIRSNTLSDLMQPVGPGYKGKSFVQYFHSHSAHEIGKVAAPVNPDTFVLISPGHDGVFGTDDDVNNIN